MRTSFLALVGLSLALVGPLPRLAAQDADFDDLFSDASQGIVEEEHETDTQPALDLDALTSRPEPLFRGTVSMDTGLGLGLAEWPWTEAAGADQWYELLDFWAGLDMKSGLSLDVRPNGYLRFYSRLDLAFNPASMAFEGPSLGELFIDYTYRHQLFFRFGQQSITWGKAMILDNPGNLVERVAEGVAARLSMPLGGLGFTALAYGTEALGGADIAKLAYALALDGSGAWLSYGLAAHYHADEDLQTTFFLKGALAGLDASIETRLDWAVDQALAGTPAAPHLQLVSNLLWEGGSPRTVCILEYAFDSAIPDYLGHSLGLAFAYRDRIWGSWRPGVNWNHAFADHSGHLLLAVDGILAPSVRATLALPVLYGPPGSTYRAKDSVLGRMVVGLGLKLSLKIDF